MPGFKSRGRLPGWSKGDPLSATRFNRMARTINDNVETLSGPKQKGGLEQNDEPEGGSITTTWSETSRTETTKSFTDTNGDTIQIAVIDQVTFEDADGRIQIFNFNNPV